MNDDIKFIEPPKRTVIRVDSVAGGALALAHEHILSRQSRLIQNELAKSWAEYDGTRAVKKRFLRLWWRWNQLEKSRLNTN